MAPAPQMEASQVGLGRSACETLFLAHHAHLNNAKRECSALSVLLSTASRGDA